MYLQGFGGFEWFIAQVLTLWSSYYSETTKALVKFT